MTVMAEIAGGCLCGKVRYSASGDPAFVGICHCRDCQKFTGSAFAVVIGVPKPAFSLQGKVSTYSKTGDTGKSIERQFCPECGSSIADEASALPSVVMISSGTLDDPSWVKPAMQIYCDSAQPWVELGGEMQSFAKMPG
jgi:hypothetical protein